MAYSLTRTKIILPRRHQDLLSRHRLLNMLDDLLEYRLILIAAPAGYGKTSLLVDLASQVAYPVCWLSIDPLDQDITRFILYFVAAIRQQFPDFGGPSISLINNHGGSELDIQQVLRTIINDLYDHVEEHFAFVLDDFHLIDSSPAVNQFLNHFVQEMDENCHLVISTRTLLSLPDLPLMVGRSQVQGLSFEELAFHPEEVKELYRIKYRQELSDQAAERAAEESEGWITGLLLSAETTRQGLTDHGRAARAAGIDLYDYLAQQVLDQQPPEMQDFLLQTSLLEEFNQALCQQALGEPLGEGSWGDLIRELLRKNLFIQPVESEGTWLRYHHLFGDFLQQRYQKQSPERAQELRQKLVEIYQTNHWYEKAYAVCQQLGDIPLTANYLQAVSPDLIHSGQISLLASWMDELPPSLVDSNPELLARRGTLAGMMGDPQSGLGMLNRALVCESQQDNPALTALILIRRSACQRHLGSYQEGLNDAQEALGQTGDDSSGRTLEAEAEREIGLNHRGLGLSQEARFHLERSLSAYQSQHDDKNTAYVEMDLGLLEMDEGQYQAAKNYFNHTYDHWKSMGNVSQLAGLCNNLGVLDHLTGSYREAFDWFTRALEYARQTSNLRGTAYTLASLADLALDLGAFSRAETYLNESTLIAEEIDEAYLLIYLLLARAALARRQGQLIPAGEHLDAVHYQISDYPAGSEMAKYHLELGLLLMAENHLDRAQTEFKAAREIFSKINLSVETCLAQIYLAWIDCLRGSLPEARASLKSVQAIVASLGTIHPLIPALSSQESPLSNLADQLPADPFIKDLIREVREFQSRLPGLLENLIFNQLPSDTSQLPYLDISILGRVRVIRRGQLISVPEWTKQKTVRELFFYLLNLQEGATREEICLVFWPDSHPEQLKKQFKNALYRLRRALGKDAILYHLPTRLYHFNRLLDYRYDVEEFNKVLNQAEAEKDPERKIQALQAAAAFYQHPFAPSLEGIWLEPVRYRLYLVYERAMLALAELQLSQDRSDASLETIEQLLQAVPSQEAAWRLAMRSYAARGDRSGIERTFQRCYQALAEDLDAEPSPETLSLYQELMS